jgi:hypothetical protein
MCEVASSSGSQSMALEKLDSVPVEVLIAFH